MPRTSKRNLNVVYEQMDLDVTGKGSKVSDDIQLTYQLGDFERYTQTQLGASGFTSAAAGLRGMMYIEILAPRGMIFWQVAEIAQASTANDFIIVGSQGTRPEIVGEDEVGFTIVGGAPPLSKNFRGHSAGGFPVGLVFRRMAEDGFVLWQGTPGLWLPFGQFLVITNNRQNQQTVPIVVCSEVGRDSAPG